MKGDPKIIALLNQVLKGELVAINQYFMHAMMCKNWGYNRLYKVIHHESIDEMKHAKELMDRILFLEGIPNLQDLGKLRVGETVEEQFKCDLALEEEAVQRLRDGIQQCYQANDHATRELLEHILVEEEKHTDWLETQLSIIKDIGIQNYLAEQMGEES